MLTRLLCAPRSYLVLFLKFIASVIPTIECVPASGPSCAHADTLIRASSAKHGPKRLVNVTELRVHRVQSVWQLRTCWPFCAALKTESLGGVQVRLHDGCWLLKWRRRGTATYRCMAWLWHGCTLLSQHAGFRMSVICTEPGPRRWQGPWATPTGTALQDVTPTSMLSRPCAEGHPRVSCTAQRSIAVSERLPRVADRAAAVTAGWGGTGGRSDMWPVSRGPQGTIAHQPGARKTVHITPGSMSMRRAAAVTKPR